ncbi:DUF4198 domain-containing protein [Algiphilus sp. W345]|uniref:DUF4198 domain-containing protein n=1 Tax=Banduia mediterranea TaxID=3075609 RepID=A0ABU2WIF0_9GAMM|nr:DUF4198 domain-containing protein [Algiphilus sp. W345]MDT0497648.1 DUF4198 domain-containing protein [Algiphilus sp. W345]
MLKRTSAVLLMAACLGLTPVAALAHKFWLLPSATVLASDQWITVDAAVSNDLFYFNHVPGRLDSLTITAPDGSSIEPENQYSGKFRSSFDVHLAQDGTYRIALVNQGLFASWEVDGEPKRWRGDAESFAKEVPADATKLRVSESSGRTEAYATAGAPTETVFQPSGVGLELVPSTHPNDLYSGETASFGFLLDGKPAVGLEVGVVPGGTRYRDRQDEISLTTDDKGQVEVSWPAPGMYWLNAELEDDKTSIPQATQRRVAYAVTLEVLPQ